MKRISSPDNPVLRLAKGLRQKKIRDREESYLIEGFHLIREVPDPVETLRCVLLRESLLSEGEREQEVRELADFLEASGVGVYAVAGDVFDRIADTETPQGILSVVRRARWSHEAFFNGERRKGSGNVIVLDRLQDPGNVGTILRTADAASFLGALILKGTVDVYSPKVVRAASGALFRLPLLFADGPLEASALLHSFGKQIAAATPYGDRYYYESGIRENTAILIGNEGGGIDPLLLAEADIRIRIPMSGSVESLNAAVAAGILMYEAMRTGPES